MSLDFERYYAASKSRDPRFDGRFFVAVLSTGIYCRPICPVRMPKRENIRFYASAAAAREDGFRPCLRCRPEASPGTPDWQGPSALVARGLHLIDQGLLDQAGIDELSSRLNVGRRQLRRLFVEHLGAPPIRVAQTRRLHFAKKLIDETRLPMTQVAFAAGFSSVRRFNDAIRATYARTPTDLRGRKQSSGSMAGDALELSLTYRPPFDWAALERFIQARAVPGVERFEDSVYRRTVSIGGMDGIISVANQRQPGRLVLHIPLELSGQALLITERVRGLFDLRADPMSIRAHFQSDPLIGPLVRRNPGLRIPGAWSAFELGVRAILGQQISVKAATTFAARLASTFGKPLRQEDDDREALLFPTAISLAESDLMRIGLPSARAQTIQRFARAAVDDPSLLETPTSLDHAIERLTAIRGIGPWTAQYIALRGLGEPDAFPAGDLGLRRGAANGDGPLSESRLCELSERWRPWRAYAAVYLWSASLTDQPADEAG